MQIPMEILSQMVTRTDSGTGVRQRAGPDPQDSFRFVKAIEEALINTETQSLINDKQPDTATVEKDTDQTESQKPDDDIDANETLAAGAMGNQNLVVCILERDKESATTLDISVGAAASAESDATTEQAETDTAPLAANTEKVESTKENTAQDGKAPETEAREENAVLAGAKTVEEQDAVNSEDAADNTAGEVMARMPDMRTSKRQEKEENNSDFSEKGNLRPLENENDTSPVKGQKEKTYSEIAEGVPETANITPMPLAEGIKPEQFRADQQMKQETLSAPVKTENLFEEMVSRLETMKTESLSKMSIQLKPEFLGKVALEIALDAAGLHVKINAADGGVRSMINGQINALIESLESKGIEVVEVEVTYTGVDNGAFKEPQKGQEQSNRSRRPYRETEAIDGAVYYSALPYETLDYYLDAGMSSVEYRA